MPFADLFAEFFERSGEASATNPNSVLTIESIRRPVFRAESAESQQRIPRGGNMTAFEAATLAEAAPLSEAATHAKAAPLSEAATLREAFDFRVIPSGAEEKSISVPLEAFQVLSCVLFHFPISYPSLVKPFFRDTLTGPEESMLLRPHAIGRLRPLVKFRIRVLKHKTDIQIRILLPDQKMFLTIFQQEASFCLDQNRFARPGFDAEIWGVHVVGFWYFVVNFVTLITEFDLVLPQEIRDFLLQTGAEAIFDGNRFRSCLLYTSPSPRDS